MLELNESNFEQAVVQKSHEIPVLVDFWADWCAPCKMIAPVLAAAGDGSGALQVLDSAFAEDPDNPHLPLPLVRLYIQERQLDKAAGLLDSLPRDLRDSDEGKSLRLLMEFAATAAQAPDRTTLEQKHHDHPDDADVLYQLASLQLVEGDYDAALENFMELLKAHRSVGDGAARRGLLAVFALLGESDERVGTYRRQMFALLH